MWMEGESSIRSDHGLDQLFRLLRTPSPAEPVAPVVQERFLNAPGLFFNGPPGPELPDRKICHLQSPFQSPNRSSVSIESSSKTFTHGHATLHVSADDFR